MRLEVPSASLFFDVHGTGEPLLFLHGGFGLGRDWQAIFDGPPDGFQIISIDQRDHGQSTGGAAVYSFRLAAIDSLALLDHLQIERAKLIGVSGGGITALHLAMLQPARVSSMVCVSAPPRFPEQAKAIQRTQSLSAIAGPDLARMRDRHPHEGQLERLFAQVRAMPDGGDPDFSRQQLASITAETLIVFGDRDPLYPLSLAVELREAIPRSWLWVIPNAGHGPVFGADAGRFASVALPFLQSSFSGTRRP
jgi:pimeloyl-ACP methyl ester carboxylesterase